MKKILISVEIPNFNPTNRYSAVASVIFSFANLLQENGYNVSINQWRVIDLTNQKQTKNTNNLSKYSIIYRFVPTRIREIVKDILYFRKLVRQKKIVEKNEKPDLIIAWVCYGSSYSVDLARNWNIPLISIFDNPLNEEYKYLKGFFPFFKRRIDKHEENILANSKAIIVYSQAVREYIKQKYKIDTLFFYKAFTDFQRMSFKKYERDFNSIKFGYIGSFFNWHKIEDLITAFINIRERGLACTLILIGDGPEYKKIREIAQQSHYSDDIVFTGRKDGEELEKLIEEINVGIIPNSLWFQAPVKLFQYSAAMLPVIYRSTPTIKELTKNSDGFLFFETLLDLELKMTYLIENKLATRELGINAQKYIAENFSEKNYIDLFYTIHSKCLN